MLKLLNKSKYLPLLVFLFSLALHISNIGGSNIYILDEAKNASCAAEMFKRGDLVVPTFNHELRTDKPPLHYYFMMLSYSIFGVNAFAARFFSAIFGALTILICFLFARKYASEKVALWTAFILLSSIHLTIQFHLAVPDPYLIFFVTSSIFSFYAAIQEKRLLYLLLLYISVGIGTLAKGPVAIGLPGLIFLLFLIFSKRFRWKEIKQLKPFMGAAIVLAIALPWYILVHIKTNGLWTEGFFMKHNIGRFSSEMEGHGGPFLVTILFIMVGLLPFSVFLVQALKKAYTNKKDDFTLLSLIAGITIVAFFTISRTKLVNYTVPAYPYFAIILALWISKLEDKKPTKSISMLILAILGLIFVPAGLIGIKLDPALSHLSNMAWYLLPLPVGFITAYFLFIKGKLRTSFVLIGLSSMVAGLFSIFIILPKIDMENPVVKSQNLVKGKEVRYFEKFNPAYSFYLQHKIDAIEVDQFSSFFREHPSGVVISTKKRIEKINLPDDLAISFSSRDILENPTTVLVTKRSR